MGSIARAVTSVAQPVSGGSTSFPTGGMFGSGLGELFSQLINQGALTPATGLPVTVPTPVTPPVTPTTPMSPIRRFNAVVDPRLSRTISRPMFRPSRYDGQINQLLERLGITSLTAPQRRPDVDQLGRRYDDPRYYKMGGRVNYQDGGSSKTPPKFIPMDLESVAFRLFKDNLDNLTYNQKQTIYDYIEQNRNKKAKGGIINLISKYSDGGKIRSYEEKYLINKGYQDMLKNMSEKDTPLSGFADTFLLKLKEQSFTIIIMVGIIWYQGKMMEERVTYWQKLYEEKETYITQTAKDDRQILLERIEYLQEQRDKYVEEALNELKDK